MIIQHIKPSPWQGQVLLWHQRWARGMCWSKKFEC